MELNPPSSTCSFRSLRDLLSLCLLEHVFSTVKLQRDLARKHLNKTNAPCRHDAASEQK